MEINICSASRKQCDTYILQRKESEQLMFKTNRGIILKAVSQSRTKNTISEVSRDLVIPLSRNSQWNFLVENFLSGIRKRKTQNRSTPLRSTTLRIDLDKQQGNRFQNQTCLSVSPVLSAHRKPIHCLFQEGGIYQKASPFLIF
ncbi:hypothetical protein CDAR_538611 [Caerostris darwini]|uniref:Uncharacterized protein n=1 Tax=Caerostris darwini TaxID=1538125 RepID=A0AAV4T9S2_9ARAC|nr:hypothetical protein CDAR_538611 [Caerostris darwini]